MDTHVLDPDSGSLQQDLIIEHPEQDLVIPNDLTVTGRIQIIARNIWVGGTLSSTHSIAITATGRFDHDRPFTAPSIEISCAPKSWWSW